MNLRSTGLAVAGAIFALLATSQAQAAGTLADTLISNTANADYEIDGNPAATVSDTVEFRVDELIDVNVVRVGGATIAMTPQGNALISFDVTNTGNGVETFDMALDGAIGGDDFDVTFSGVFAYLDNGDLTFSAATDTPFNPATDDLTLAPDETRRVFVLADIPAGLADDDRSDVELSAATTTGALAGAAPGTAADGLGSGTGIDAVVGATGGIGSDTQSYVVSAVVVAVDKTVQSVADGFGGDQLIPGAVVTYRIAVSVTGTGTAESLRISDAIAPAATSSLAYLRQSVILEGIGQTDAADAPTATERTTVTFTDPADASLPAGEAATGGVTVEVDLGDVDGPADFSIELEVEIQ